MIIRIITLKECIMILYINFEIFHLDFLIEML